MSAILVEVFRDAQELMLAGTYDIAAATLAISLLDTTATLLDVDTTGLTYDQSSDTHSVNTAAITSQAWVWDAATRTNALVPSGSIGWTAGGSETFRHGYLYDTANTKPPIALITWPADTTVVAGAHVLDIGALLRVRLYTDLAPAPLGSVMRPLVLKDTDLVYWRVTAPGGTLTTATTSEVDDTDAFLTSPDATTWLLVVSVTGVVTAVNTGTLDPGDRLFDTSLPCLLPTGNPAVLHTLTVDNSGVLTVT